MKSRLAGALLLTTPLAACGVGPSYQRPATQIPPSYTSPAKPQPAPPPLDTAWWHGFAAPDLDRLMAQAQAASPDVAAAAARIIQADQAARAAGAPLLPGVTGTASQNWQRSGTSTSFGNASSLLSGQFGHASRYTQDRTYTAELQASYELDFWGKNLDALQNAKALALASRFDAQTVWLTTAAGIATTYFNALGLRDRLEIAERNLHSAEATLAAYRARLDAGTASALDVSQQEALAAGYRAQIPALQSQYRQQVLALATLVGAAPETITLGRAHLTDLILPPIAPGLPADLLRRRPDVAEAEADLIAQNATIRQDVADFFPSLQLTAAGGVSSLALSAITGPGTLVSSLASQLTQTIFDNGLKSGTLGQAKGRYQELAADYTKAVLQALVDVETALTQTSYNAEQERLEADAVRTARKSADIARAQLEAGTVDIVSVLNTETTLFTDEDTLAQVRISRFTAAVSLYKALGGGWTSAPGAMDRIIPRALPATLMHGLTAAAPSASSK